MALTSMQGSLEAAVQVVDQSNQEVETHADKAQDAPRKWELSKIEQWPKPWWFSFF